MVANAVANVVHSKKHDSRRHRYLLALFTLSTGFPVKLKIWQNAISFTVWEKSGQCEILQIKSRKKVKEKSSTKNRIPKAVFYH